MLGAFQIYRQLKEYGEGESSYTEIEQYVWVDEAPEDSGDEEQNGSQSGEREPDLRWPAVENCANARLMVCSFLLSR